MTIEPFARQCGTVAVLMILGLGLHLFNAAEVLISLMFSGALISLLGLALLSGFLVWQGGKLAAARVASWNSMQPASRPVVLATRESAE